MLGQLPATSWIPAQGSKRRAALCLLLLGFATSEGADEVPKLEPLVGCCFKIGYAAFMKPCCLSVEELAEQDCYSSDIRDPGTAQPDAVQGLLKLSVRTVVGGDRGWRAQCPENAEEAAQFIKEDKEASASSSPAPLLGVAPAHPQEPEEHLPWWAFLVIGLAMALASSVAIVQAMEGAQKSWRRKQMNTGKASELDEDMEDPLEPREDMEVLLPPQPMASARSPLVFNSPSPSSAEAFARAAGSVSTPIAQPVILPKAVPSPSNWRPNAGPVVQVFYSTSPVASS